MYTLIKHVGQFANFDILSLSKEHILHGPIQFCEMIIRNIHFNIRNLEKTFSNKFDVFNNVRGYDWDCLEKKSVQMKIMCHFLRKNQSEGTENFTKRRHRAIYLNTF